jgi:tripartite-type tricarboxylate transporter receptor subunit TctC
MNRRAFVALAAASPFVALSPLGLSAQTIFPTRPVRVIVPFAAGGALDVIARLVANRLAEMWNQQVIVENRTGAGGNLGAELVARAEPDGHTIKINASSLVVNTFLYSNMTFDAIADFAPLSLVCEQANLMVVPQTSPAKSVAEFIAHAKANPGKLTFASTGLGTSLYLSAELLKAKAGLDMIHVPYRGTAPAMADLIPGRIDLMFFSVASVLPAVNQGTVRALGVTSLKRLSVVPNVPTIAEAALPGYEVNTWFGFFAPARTPPDIVRKLGSDIAAASLHPPVKARLEELGSVVVGSSSEELAAAMRQEMNTWGPLIKSLGVKASP